MDALISIPDLDDDTVYPITSSHNDGAATSHHANASSAAESTRPRPFRGMELAEHSRSGSAVSFESSTGSRTGGFAGMPSGRGNGGAPSFGATSGSSGSGTGGASSHVAIASATMPSFPRKSSFASLKAAFKGAGAASSPQDAYPPQLRNPFSNGATATKSSIVSPIDDARSHARNDSFTSQGAASSRSRLAQLPTSSSSQRHIHQSSLYSENSIGGTSTSISESTTGTGSGFRSAPAYPPLPPFPEAYMGNGGPPSASSSLPPARTAYARSMSAQDRSMGPPIYNRGDVEYAKLQKNFASAGGASHGRQASQQSSEHHNDMQTSAAQWMAAYPDDVEAPLQPPQPVFAESWHQRGSSGGGSRAGSEDGTRPSFDQQSLRNGSTSRQGGAAAMHGMPPIRSDRFVQRPRVPLMMGDNASVASLPSGIGLEEPASPAEYAINVLCIRFLTLAGVRIRTAIGGVDESDPPLERNVGPGADAALDTLLDSLAHVSRKTPGPVIKSMFQWRDNMMEERIDVGEVRGALAGSQAGLSLGVKDVANVLMRRKALSTAYLLSCVLIRIASGFSPGQGENSIKGLSDASVLDLQARAFALMRECSRERFPASRMQSDAFDKAARLLGVLSKVCFAAVGDQFVSFLEQVHRSNVSQKEVDPSAEAAVTAVRHLVITSFPMELFEEGAEFLEVMARNFAAAHGQRLKSIYAESLCNLLLPVATSASAELHHPTWVKALDAIAPRAFAMTSKPRYWTVAYPLYVAVLCVSPEERFMQSAQAWTWVQCIDAGVVKLGKDRATRSIVLNAALHMLWTYAFRCRESSTVTAKRLETFFRTWFPANRPALFPIDVPVLDWHVYMTHYVLYRQFDFGREFVLELLRAQTLSGNTLSLQPDVLSKQRMTVAIRAILLTLDAHVKETSPPFPADVTQLKVEREGLGDELPESFKFPTVEIGTTQAQFNDLIGKIALLCNHQIGTVSVFDEQVVLTRSASVATAIALSKVNTDEERLCWRLHASHRFVAAFNKDHVPYMDLLRACIDSWPRCLSVNVPFANVLGVLHHAYFSADPDLAHAASRCLIRIAEQRKGGATAIASSFMRLILRVDAVCWETHPNQTLILSKIEGAVKLLTSFLAIWLAELKKSQMSTSAANVMERTSAWAIIDEVEALGLFLLCSAWRPLRRHAIGILRIVSVLDGVFAGGGKANLQRPLDDEQEDIERESEPTRVIHLLAMPCSRFLQTSDDPRSEEATDISAWQRARSKKWRRAPSTKETLLDLAEGDKSNELTTWLLVVPRFLRMCLDHFPTTIAVFRSIVTSRILGMESVVSVAAGISNRIPASGASTLKGQATVAAGALMPFSLGGGGSGGGGTTGSTASATAAANASSASTTAPLTPEQNLMADHWRMYILALCTTTTSIEGSAHRGKHSEGLSTERVIAAKDLFQKMVPYLASDHARFREAVITALGNINTNLYKTLLETLQTVNAQLSEDFRRPGAKRNRHHERLRLSLAHVIQLTSAHMTREGALTDASVVYSILQWVKETFHFLIDREIRLDWEFHRLRRFFAGVVEEFFDALYQPLRPPNETAERFLTAETKLRMFHLFRDWHSFSQAAKDGPAKLANLLASVAEQSRDDRNRELILTSLRNDTQLLSFHASSAMAALCQGVIAVADGAGAATTTTSTTASLEPSLLSDWLKHLFLSPSPQNHAVARRALKALLMNNANNVALVRLTLEHGFSESEQTTANRSFFAVFADAVVEQQKRGVRLSLALPQILCLGLVKLGHPDVDTRKKAFMLLSSVAPVPVESDAGGGGGGGLQSLEGGVSNPLPATYLRAQRDISTSLAERLREHKIAMLSEYALRLPAIDLSRRATTLGLLPEWVQRIQLRTADETQQQQQRKDTGMVLSRRAMLVLSNMLALTIRYGDEHNFEIQDMWTSLAEGEESAANATLIVKFLIQQALALRSSVYIMHAKRAVSCLSHTALAPTLFAEMCSYIEPSSMIPVPLEVNRLAASDAQLDHLYMANVEAHLPLPSRRQTFSPGQVALLFVGELTYEKSAMLLDKLPLLLHAIFMHVDSTSAFTQEQCMSMFEQLMRSLSAETGAADKAVVTAQAEALFDKGTSLFWTQDEQDVDATQTPRVMRSTVVDTLSLVKHHVEGVHERWGNVALLWATSNPVRHMACRSFQMFRILLPEVNYSMLADMLARLSNTISDSTRVDNQSFALEILYTMKAVVRSIARTEERRPGGGGGQRDAMLGHIFWMNVACLSTVNEAEFGQAVGLMHLLLQRIDLDSSETVALIRAQCPDGWEGEVGCLQNLVMRGLRSSALYEHSFSLLARMAKISNARLVDGNDSRVGYLFIISLPWFLQATDDPASLDEAMITTLAEDIARLASDGGKADVERVAISIAKKRFRTKDDLLRQAVSSCVRAGFLPTHAVGMALTLLSLTFNAQSWLRRQTLQVVKSFFQSVDTRRHDFHELGPELLMPLLRLLSTDLSMDALEVLDEKILATAPTTTAATPAPQRRGPNAQQIVRMSLQWRHAPNAFAMMRGGGADRGVAAASRRVEHNGRPALHHAQTSFRQEDADARHRDDVQESNSLFGLPEESGWSVADIPEWTSRTRINILSVFKSVEMLLDTPPVGEVNFVDDYDAEGENVFEQTMTASRFEGDEMESASMVDPPANSLHGGGGGSSAAGVLLPEQASFTSQSSLQRRRRDDGGDSISSAAAAADRANVGDIVSQLHDLSSFFIDDDYSGTAAGDADTTAQMQTTTTKSRISRRRNNGTSTSARLTNFWSGGGGVSSSSSSGGGSVRGMHGLEESGEQIAKILSRSALASMIGRTTTTSSDSMRMAGNGAASEEGEDPRNAPLTPVFEGSSGATIAASNSGASMQADSVASSGGGAQSTTTTANSNKRGSMWVRKSLFGRRGPTNTPSSLTIAKANGGGARSASEGTPTSSEGGDQLAAYGSSSPPPPLPTSLSAPTVAVAELDDAR